MATAPPERAAATTRAYVPAACRSIQSSSVGPKSKLIEAGELIGQTLHGLGRVAHERLDQPLGIVAVLREATLGVVHHGPGRDDELPVGRLRQQQLARRLRQ